MPPETETGFAAVSVIIPAYRAAGTIARALRSVGAQTLKPKEIVVVDDGSDDGTLQAAEAVVPSLQGIQVKLVRQARQGAGAARNHAIAESSEPVLAFLDADDEWLPEKLARSLQVMESAGATLVAHNGWIVDGERASLNDCARRFRSGNDPFVSLYRKGYIDTCTVVARRDAVAAAGGFDAGLPNAQDFDLWLAIASAPNAKLAVFDEPLARYHVAAAGIMSNTESRLRCCLQVALRHAGALRGRPGLPLASLWYRIAAVHYEAVQAYRSRGHMGRALGVASRLPFAAAAMTARYLAGETEPRAALAQGIGTPLLYWIWIGTVLALYLYQFKPLAGPILGLLRLS
ncbi:MAG: glycosyltransferase [Rhodospirillales bacterium]|nr:glycosyltransferase [Rhodospirillales bacterium]